MPVARQRFTLKDAKREAAADFFADVLFKRKEYRGEFATALKYGNELPEGSYEASLSALPKKVNKIFPKTNNHPFAVIVLKRSGTILQCLQSDLSKNSILKMLKWKSWQGSFASWLLSTTRTETIGITIWIGNFFVWW